MTDRVFTSFHRLLMVEGRGGIPTTVMSSILKLFILLNKSNIRVVTVKKKCFVTNVFI